MKFSIITPSYNQGEFLEQTIKSVVTQKGNFELEYFIIDGGSTDNSVSIIKKYAKKYPKIISWQSKKDKGQVDAINQGMKKASGDIVAYLNSDDYYLPGTFKKVVSFFKSNPKKLWLAGNCQVSDPKLKWTFFLKHLWPINWHKNFLLIFNTINQPSVFLTTKLVKKVGIFSTKYNYAFDYDYWLRCLKTSLPGRIHQNFSVFRIHQGSKGNTSFSKQFKEDLQIAQNHSNNSLILSIHRLISDIATTIYRFLKP